MKNIETLPGPGRLLSRPVPGRPLFPRCALFLATSAAIVLLGTLPALAAPTLRGPHAPQPVRFAVLSDTHLYDTRLGTSGSAFEMNLIANPNLQALSQPILEAAIDDIINSQVRFVIISGDLTKDGELINHFLMVRHLERLERAGVQVFVVPGNHDLNNHDAARYSGDTATPVATIPPFIFRLLYRPFGYGQAIDHAPDSLSYVAEPAPGLWLLALDSIKAEESAQSEHPVVSGRLTDATLAWAVAKLQQAQIHHKQVIAFMHHGVNMHFGAQPLVFPDYLVDNWWQVGPTLAGAGLKVIFTGHYHSQDAAWLADANGLPVPDTLCDIGTGSLVMEPCAYRIAELDTAGQLHVTSQRVTSIAVDLGMPFQTFADAYLRALVPYQVIFALQAPPFSLDAGTAASVEPWVTDALIANYVGDEEPSPETLATLQWLLSFPLGDPHNTLGQMLGTLWIDSPPSDNELTVPVGT